MNSLVGLAPCCDLSVPSRIFKPMKSMHLTNVHHYGSTSFLQQVYGDEAVQVRGVRIVVPLAVDRDFVSALGGQHTKLRPEQPLRNARRFVLLSPLRHLPDVR